MNFKLFTAALLATAAMGQSADRLQSNFEEIPEHVQRRFWVSIKSVTKELHLLDFWK